MLSMIRDSVIVFVIFSVIAGVVMLAFALCKAASDAENATENRPVIKHTHKKPICLIDRNELYKAWDELSDDITDPWILRDEMIRATQDMPCLEIDADTLEEMEI